MHCSKNLIITVLPVYFSATVFMCTRVNMWQFVTLFWYVKRVCWTLSVNLKKIDVKSKSTKIFSVLFRTTDRPSLLLHRSSGLHEIRVLRRQDGGQVGLKGRVGVRLPGELQLGEGRRHHAEDFEPSDNHNSALPLQKSKKIRIYSD